MTDLEKRLTELERRVALLETQHASAAPADLPQELPPPPALPGPLKVAVSNKRFDPANPGLGTYDDHIWFDCVYTLAPHVKATRAIKGTLEFADLFGEVRFRLQSTLNTSLSPGASTREDGIGFSYNQFMTEHQWMLATALKDMRCTFNVQSLLYVDGTSEQLR